MSYVSFPSFPTTLNGHALSPDTREDRLHNVYTDIYHKIVEVELSPLTTHPLDWGGGAAAAVLVVFSGLSCHVHSYPASSP